MMTYVFHGTNAKLLDDGLVAGTYFTDDLEIALKYGKKIYVLNHFIHHRHLVINNEGYYVSNCFIPTEYMTVLAALK